MRADLQDMEGGGGDGEVEILRQILAATDDYVYVGEFLADGSYSLVYQGPARGRFLGLDPEAARDVVWADHVHPDDREIFARMHEDALTVGVLDGEYRLVGADGVLRWVRDRARVRRQGSRVFLDGSVLDVTEIHQTQEALEAARAESDRLGRLDPLTGVANRRALPDLLDRRLAAGDVGLGVLLLDIDRFKLINDRYGHGAGDDVLVEVARRIRATTRLDDSVARIGGEEFLVLLHGMADEAALRRSGEAIRRAVAVTPIAAGGNSVPVTLSVGGALSAADCMARERLIGAADRALYAAKRQGRDKVVLAGDLGGLDAGDLDSEELRLARAMALTTGARPGARAGEADAVSRLAAAVATQLGASPTVVARCRAAALVRDLGTLALPDELLAHDGAFHAAEWELVRRHPAVGEQLIGEVAELRHLAPIVRHHHERFDGRGYPDGFAGEAIPLEARIIAAADTFVAMTSPRPHRGAMPRDRAIGEPRACAGTQLDPTVVEALLAAAGAGPAAALEAVAA